MSGITDFIAHEKASGGSEQANSLLFLTELHDALELLCLGPARPANEEKTPVLVSRVSNWLCGLLSAHN